MKLDKMIEDLDKAEALSKQGKHLEALNILVPNESSPSADYPLGGSLEPYDIETEKDLMN